MWYSKPDRLFSQKIDRIKSQLSTMADLVREGGCVDEGELFVLEKSGVLASPKLKGKAKARSTNRPKHIVFVEEGEEGSFCLVSCRAHVGNLSRPDTYEGPSNPVPATETTPNDDGSDIDLGWKPEARQKRKKGKQKAQGQDESDLQLLEEESKVWCIPVLSTVILTRNCFAQKHRRRLVQELSARMERDQQLRYAERELEMQRLLMGKGRTKKLKGVEVVKGESDEDEGDGEVDEDRPARSTGKTYKPRVYKWKAERKR